MPETDIPWGPTGKVVYDRTYSRTKDDGSKETWPETVRRVAEGNLSLVYGERSSWSIDTQLEYANLINYMKNFALLPAGRHLWASGVTGFLFNCHHSGWGYRRLSDHFSFTALRLFEGGGVGANYSTKHIEKYGTPKRPIDVAIAISEDHPDFEESISAGAVNIDFGITVEDSREGWAEAMVTLIDYAYSKPSKDSENRIIFDASRIRPSGYPLATSGGTASGPAPFVTMMLKISDVLNKAYYAETLTPLDCMEIDHAIAEAVVSGGNRRSARMAIVNWKDPYIFDFINCKQDTGLHWTTNISVEIDDEFIRNLQLSNGDTAQEVSHAQAVHSAVCKAVLENGEPGYWNVSLNAYGEINRAEICCNPCSEITLEPWEACNLGHINLDYFHDKPAEELYNAHRLMTRFLIRATFGEVKDPSQRKVMDKNRRIGVGHLGVQGYWNKRGVKYSDIPAVAPEFLDGLYHAVRMEARKYAFELRIPEPVKVTTVAPTGSISKLPGVSEGIHPIYARWYDRRVRFSMRDEDQWNTVMQAQIDGFKVEDDQYDSSGMTKVVVYPTEDILVSQVRELGIDESVVESAEELSIDQMLAVQATYQKYWADNAVSYTCNIPEGSITPKELEKILAAWLPDLKGTTIMVDASRPQAPYTRISHEEYLSAKAVKVEDSTSEECSNGACPVR